MRIMNYELGECFDPRVIIARRPRIAYHIGMSDEQKYNEAYIKAKEQQAAKHAAHDKVSESHARLPPGQVETKVFPILDLGVRPSLARYPKWKLEIYGEVGKPQSASIEELRQLGGGEITADFHCVTRWSRFDLRWTGIPFQKVIDWVKPTAAARFVTFHSFDKYAANAALGELVKPNVIVAYELEGKEIPPEHGGPIRMLIPQLYGWKSAKFLTGIEFTREDRPGFWEVRGYSNHARPWIEERYSSD